MREKYLHHIIDTIKPIFYLLFLLINFFWRLTQKVTNKEAFFDYMVKVIQNKCFC